MYCINSTSRLITFISFYFLQICAIIFCGYGTYKMYRKIWARHDAFMQARHPTLSFSILLMNCIDLMLIQPIHCLIFFLILQPKSNYNHHYITYISIAILSDIRFMIFGFFFSARIWLISYDYHFGKQCVALLFRRKNQKKTVTNTRQKSKWDNFYLNHRQTMGNPKRVIIATVVLILLFVSILHILPLLLSLNDIAYLSLNDYIRIPIYLIEGALLITLYFKVQSIDDKFKIRLEILYILCIPGLFSLIYMSFQILVTLKPITNSHIFDDCQFFYIYSYFMLSIVSGTIIIKTNVVLSMHKNQSQSVQHTLNLMKQNKAGKDVSFGDILGSAQGLLLFVEHLETEFSVENILFIVFIAKYREHYMRQIIPPLISLNSSIIASPSHRKRDCNKESPFTLNTPLTIHTNESDEYSTTNNKSIANITPKQDITPNNRKMFKFNYENSALSNHNSTELEIKTAEKSSPNIGAIQLQMSDEITDKPPSPESVSKVNEIKNDKVRILDIGDITRQLERKTRATRTPSGVSDSKSCLRTPVPGSFKHAPMILEEKQKELFSEEEVFSLDDIESTFEDDINNNEIQDNEGMEFLNYDLYINDKRLQVTNYTSPEQDVVTVPKSINIKANWSDIIVSDIADVLVLNKKEPKTECLPTANCSSLPEEDEDNSDAMSDICDSDNEELLTPVLHSQKKSKSVNDSNDEQTIKQRRIKQSKHKRNLTLQTLQSMISKANMRTLQNREALTHSLQLNASANKLQKSVDSSELKYDEPITPVTPVTDNTTEQNESESESDCNCEKQDLIHKTVKSKTEILSCTDTQQSGEIISPFTPESPPLFDDKKRQKSSRKLHDLLNGKCDYASVATVIQTQPNFLRGQSVDLTIGGREKQISEKQKEMKRLSILQSIFGRENKPKSEEKMNGNRKSIISLPDRSERSSIFGSNKERSIKYSNRINIDIVRDSIDFDLNCDISRIVNPLTQDFIPIPTSFNNVDIKEAAQHIFAKFIDDGAPYMINISHENRVKLKQLFADTIFWELSPLSKIFLFDATFHEIYVTIASDSFLRFKSSKPFRNFLREGHLKNIMPERVNGKREDSQWSFNASFIDFNSSLYDRTTENERPLPSGHNLQLKALPSGQII